MGNLVTSFSQVRRNTWLISYTAQASLCFSKALKFFLFNMVGSRCVVQGCSNRRNKAAGLALNASPTDRTRDLWVRFVRIKRENFYPQPQAKFLICSVYFEENNCFTRAFNSTQRRQLKPGSLPSIWGRKSHLQKGIQWDKVVWRRRSGKSLVSCGFFLCYTFVLSCTRFLIF